MEWKAGAGFQDDPYRDTEWLSPSTYVWRTNSEILTAVTESFMNKESQMMLVVSDYGLGKSAFRHALSITLSQEAARRRRTFQQMTLLQAEWTELQLYKEVAVKLSRSDQGDRHSVRRRVEEAIGEKAERGMELLLTVDDSHYLKPSGYHALKHISDLEINGRKLCPVLMLGYYKVAEALKVGDLAQVADRATLRKQLNIFTQRDVFEYVARTCEWAKGRPLPQSYQFPAAAAGDTAAAQRVSAEFPKLLPFSALSVLRIYALTRNPRYVRLLCSEAIKVQAEGSDALQAPARFTIEPEIIDQAWERVKFVMQEEGGKPYPGE